MKDILYITGHKNPDTDSICSSIAYAEFKNKTQHIHAIPIRLGELNKESQFVLDYFNVKSPALIGTVKPQISDLNIDRVAPISPEVSLKVAWSMMKKNEMRALPVVDDDSKLLGIVTLSNLTSTYMDIWDSKILYKSSTSLENILDTLTAECVYKNETIDTFKGKILVGAMKPSSAEKMIEEGDIVICGDRKDFQELIVNSKASLMVVTGGYKVDDDIIKKAKNTGCSIVITPYDSFTAARLITQCIPVSYVMVKDNIIKFSENDLVDDIKDIMLKTRYRTYPVLDSNGRVIGSISRYHLISQNKKKVILMDHNEKTQSVYGIEDADVLEIIDHHRIADIQTGQPIFFRNEPVGSTATIVASIFFENGLRPSKKIAGLLAAAIISDTLYFKSPTTTNTDKTLLKRLAEIADINTDEFAKEMFKEGTSLKGKTVEDIFNQDLKIFTIDEYKIGISQVGTMDMDSFNPIREEMVEYMSRRASHGGFNILVLMITDILNNGSEILSAGPDKDIISKAFDIDKNNDVAYLPGILSRKKQIIPPITSFIASIKNA